MCGHDSDDRNVVIYPFEQGDPEGYWESNSNLDKGLQLRDLLEEAGIKVTMSRTTNTSEDDLNLTTIGTLANESGADIFFSIHSNATGTGNRVNYPIGLIAVIPVNLRWKTVTILLNACCRSS